MKQQLQVDITRSERIDRIQTRGLDNEILVPPKAPKLKPLPNPPFEPLNIFALYPLPISTQSHIQSIERLTECGDDEIIFGDYNQGRGNNCFSTHLLPR